MNAETPRVLEVTRRFTASPERVFDAWLDPQTTGRWLFATEMGEMVRVEIDARVGGRFTITERRSGEEIEHAGEYLEIDRPRRLVFTFGVPKFSSLTTRVTIDIVPRGTGCELTLTHEGVLPEWADRTRAGWNKLLENLEDVLDAAPPRFGEILSDDTVRFERLLPGPIERVWSYLAESALRGQWFASGELPPRVGAETTLYFDHANLSPHKEPPPERFAQCKEVIPSPHRVTCYEPPTRLGISWGDAASPSEVLFELSPRGEKVLLTLTHRRLANRKEMMDVGGGWHAHLAVLGERLHGRTPPAFWTLFGDIDYVYQRRFKSE